MFERFRSLRQSDRARDKMKEAVRPTVLDADIVDAHMREYGFFVLPKGTTVLVDVWLDQLKWRQRSPRLGEVTLESDVECEVYSWEKDRMNTQSPEQSAVVNLGPSSPEMRNLSKRYDVGFSNLTFLLNQEPQDEEDIDRFEEEVFGEVVEEKEEETERLGQTTLQSNPGISSLLRQKGIDSARVTGVAFEAAVSHYIEQPL